MNEKSEHKKYDSPNSVWLDGAFLAIGLLVAVGLNLGPALSGIADSFNWINWAVLLFSAVVILLYIVHKLRKTAITRLHQVSVMFCLGWFLCAYVFTTISK